MKRLDTQVHHNHYTMKTIHIRSPSSYYTIKTHHTSPSQPLNHEDYTQHTATISLKPDHYSHINTHDTIQKHTHAFMGF